MDYLSPVPFRRVTVRGADVTFEFDFARQSCVRDAGDGVVHLPLRYDRNELFPAAMRDFLDVIADRPIADGRHITRLDRVKDNCMLIAHAWEGREFIGTLSGDFA